MISRRARGARMRASRGCPAAPRSAAPPPPCPSPPGPGPGHNCRRFPGPRGPRFQQFLAQLQHQVGDLLRVHVHLHPQIGIFRGGVGDLAEHRQVHRGHQATERPIGDFPIPQPHRLGALGDQAERRVVHRGAHAAGGGIGAHQLQAGDRGVVEAFVGGPFLDLARQSFRQSGQVVVQWFEDGLVGNHESALRFAGKPLFCR